MNAPAAEPGRSPLRTLFANPDFRRLWGAGGLTNAMRWLDMLVSGLFTFELTGSAFAVSLVLMARAVPMLLVGALAGAVAESLNRKRLLMAGQVAQVAGALAIAALSFTGALAPWHLFLNGMVGGLAWTNELATRRRMVAETAGPAHIVQAVAIDSMSASTTRMVGPLAGGLFYQTIGVTAAFLVAAACYFAALLQVRGVIHIQQPRQLVQQAHDNVPLPQYLICVGQTAPVTQRGGQTVQRILGSEGLQEQVKLLCQRGGGRTGGFFHKGGDALDHFGLALAMRNVTRVGHERELCGGTGERNDAFGVARAAVFVVDAVNDQQRTAELGQGRVQ